MTSMATSPVFACLRCGNCCRHPGEVRLQDHEAEDIAAALGLDVHTFAHRYTRLRDDRLGLSLLENADGSCIFLHTIHDSPFTPLPSPSPPPVSSCRIQSAKPRQCREFPFSWQYENLTAICAAARNAPPTSYRHSPITDRSLSLSPVPLPNR